MRAVPSFSSASFRRSARLLAILLVSVVVLAPTSAQAGGARDGDPRITVMTRNLYLGTGLDNLVTAPTPEAFVTAVTQDFANVVATDFPTRADALAREIRNVRPDVVGLQEVTLWRQQTPADSPDNNGLPNADVVVYDFLALLTEALARRGAHYSVALVTTNADVEAPRFDPFSNTLVDVRLTDRDVILVKRGVKWSNPQSAHFHAQLALPIAAGRTIVFTRGWHSVDVQSGHKALRFFNSHLEVGQAGPIQVAQGAELLAAIGASPLPVVAVGDFNSPADGTGTGTYQLLVQSGLVDAWTSVKGARGGYTCCQNELLTNRVSQNRERIDLVLTAGPWRTLAARRVGAWPFRLSPPPLWASDHAGVAATLKLGG